jgi:uncharacterized protein (DUF486 family)
MHDDTVLALQGASVLITSTLYFAFVFAFALTTNNRPAALASIVAVGVTYLFNTYQLAVPRNALHMPFFFATIGAATAAGILLLV